MATFSQFIGNPKMKKSVAIIAGRNDALVRTALEELEGRVNPDQVRRIDARETSTRKLMNQLSETDAFSGDEMVVFDGLTTNHDLRPLVEYAKNPLEKTTLVITSNAVKRRDGERWIPSMKKVLYVDCNTASESALLTMGKRLGLSEEDAEWLVEYAAGDASEIVRILDLCSVFEGWPVREVAPPLSLQADRFAEYAMFPSASDHQLANKLMERLPQLALLAFLGDADTRETMYRVDLEPFLVKRLQPLAQSGKPDQWIRRVSDLSRFSRYTDSPRFADVIWAMLKT